MEEPAALLGLDPGALEVTGPADAVAGPFRVTEAVTAAIGCSALSSAAWLAVAGLPRPHVSLDTRDAVVAAHSEAHLRIDRARPSGWDPLSGLARARDGWVRLHTNYPHHREALCSLLAIPESRDALDAAVAGWDGDDLEDALARAGGIGVKVRTPAEWAKTPQAQAISGIPLLSQSVGSPGAVNHGPPRVLDLTRVIAGPVATRTLALGGCDVLRVDRPDRPELVGWADTGLGKRTAFADLRSYDVHSLVAQADVVVVGYRADALPSLRALLDRPGLVVVELNAWGWTGPWRDRRGFDSIVQAATGLNVACGSLEHPGQLPLQALDHCTGYLAAACAWRGLALRAGDGRGRRYRLALAQTARWLGPPRETSGAAVDLDPVTVSLPSGYGATTVAAPAYLLDGVRPSWPSGAHLPGADAVEWLPR